MRFAFPLALEVTGRRCVVIGGGATATAKVAALLDAGAAVAMIAAEPEGGLVELAARGEIELVVREYRRGDLAGALLVFATGDRAQNAAVFAEAEAEGVLCNAHQDSEHCHFASPTVTRRGDLVVAVSTGGRAPTLAGYVRDLLAADLPDELGALIDLVAEIRAEGIAPDDLAERGRLWRTALEYDVLGLLGAGQWEAARRLLRAVLAGHHASGVPFPGHSGEGTPVREDEAPGGWVSIVGAGPGDPDLITVRGRAALDAADVVVHDRLVHATRRTARRSTGTGSPRPPTPWSSSWDWPGWRRSPSGSWPPAATRTRPPRSCPVVRCPTSASSARRWRGSPRRRPRPGCPDRRCSSSGTSSACPTGSRGSAPAPPSGGKNEFLSRKHRAARLFTARP